MKVEMKHEGLRTARGTKRRASFSPILLALALGLTLIPTAPDPLAHARPAVGKSKGGAGGRNWVRVETARRRKIEHDRRVHTIETSGLGIRGERAEKLAYASSDSRSIKSVVSAALLCGAAGRLTPAKSELLNATIDLAIAVSEETGVARSQNRPIHQIFDQTAGVLRGDDQHLEGLAQLVGKLTKDRRREESVSAAFRRIAESRVSAATLPESEIAHLRADSAFSAFNPEKTPTTLYVETSSSTAANITGATVFAPSSTRRSIVVVPIETLDGSVHPGVLRFAPGLQRWAATSDTTSALIGGIPLLSSGRQSERHLVVFRARGDLLSLPVLALSPEWATVELKSRSSAESLLRVIRGVDALGTTELRHITLIVEKAVILGAAEGSMPWRSIGRVIVVERDGIDVLRVLEHENRETEDDGGGNLCIDEPWRRECMCRGDDSKSTLCTGPVSPDRG